MTHPDPCSRRAALKWAVAAGLSAGGALASTAAQANIRALSQKSLPVVRPTRAVLQGVVQAGARLIAVGERGLILRSDDSGQTWLQSDVPVSCTLTAVRFMDAQRGWVVGHMGVVLETSDGGVSWTKLLDGQQAALLVQQAARTLLKTTQQPVAVAEATRLAEDAERLVVEGPDKPMLGVGIAPDGSLLAVGAYGLAVTRHGGGPWRSYMEHLPNPDGLTLYGSAERGPERWLYGEQGILLRSAAPGQAYVSQASPSEGSLFGSVVLRDGMVLLLGLRGRVWRSARVGEAWQPIRTPVDASLLAGTQLADGSVLLVGAAGQALISRDGGQSFHPLTLSQRFPFTGVAQAADGSVLLVGMRGLLRLTPAEFKVASKVG